MAEAERAVNAVPTSTPPAHGKPGFRSAAEYAQQVITDAEERRNLPVGIYGLRTGWATVDRHFGGHKWQQSILICGGSGLGKTTLMMHPLFATVAQLLDTRSDSVCLVKQLEGGIEQYLWFWAAYRYGLPLWAFHPGGQDRLSDEQHDLVMRAYSEFPTLPIEFSEETDGDRMLWGVEQRVGRGPVEAIFLDNVQLLTFQGNKWQGLDRIAGRVKDLCRETGVPFVALSQVNSHKGQSDSPRGVPDWYNGASCVFMVKRGESGQVREEALKTNVTRVVNHKLRHSTKGTMPEVRLMMDLATKRLWEEREWQRMQAEAGARETAGRGWPNN